MVKSVISTFLGRVIGIERKRDFLSHCCQISWKFNSAIVLISGKVVSLRGGRIQIQKSKAGIQIWISQAKISIINSRQESRYIGTRPSALGKSDPFCGPSNPWHLFTKDYTIFCGPSNPQYLFPKDYAIFVWQIIDIDKKFCTVGINFWPQLLNQFPFFVKFFLVKFFWVKICLGVKISG